MKKKKLLYIGYALLLCFPVSLFSQTTNVTSLGKIGISCAEYVNNMNRTWNINISDNRKLVLDYHVRVEHSYDKVLIYSIDNSGTAVLQATLTGSQDGSIKSLYPNGKMRVVFTSDISVNCSTNPTYSGFEISISKIAGIQYAYDASGNRIGRTIYLERGAPTLRSGTSEDQEEEIVFVEKLDYRESIDTPEAEIRIYPNPTEGRFAVAIANVTEDAGGEIHLTDIKGKLLDKRSITGDGKVDFDLSREASGIYIVMIRLGDAVSTWKIIKK